MKPKRSNKATVSQLDALCREFVFRRDGYKCARYGTTEHLQWCHVYSRRYQSVRWLPENSFCGSAKFHLEWHHRPADALGWWEAAYPRRGDYIRLMMRSKSKVDKEALILWFKQQLGESK